MLPTRGRTAPITILVPTPDEAAGRSAGRSSMSGRHRRSPSTCRRAGRRDGYTSRHPRALPSLRGPWPPPLRRSRRAWSRPGAVDGRAGESIEGRTLSWCVKAHCQRRRSAREQPLRGRGTYLCHTRHTARRWRGKRTTRSNNRRRATAARKGGNASRPGGGGCSKMVDVHNRLRKCLRSFLRHIVADAVQDSMCVLA